MNFVFTDRESAYPYRYRITRENGTSEFVVLERADEPVVVGTPLNAETFNALIGDLYENAGIASPEKATVGQYIRVKAVDENGEITETETADAVEEIPVTVDEEGYTDITGLRQPTDIRVVKSGNRITMTTTVQGGKTVTSVIALDGEGYPTTITTDGLACALSWEGFDE